MDAWTYQRLLLLSGQRTALGTSRALRSRPHARELRIVSGGLQGGLLPVLPPLRAQRGVQVAQLRGERGGEVGEVGLRDAELCRGRG
jgi:hypothetical protein